MKTTDRFSATGESLDLARHHYELAREEYEACHSYPGSTLWCALWDALQAAEQHLAKVELFYARRIAGA